MSMNYTPSGLSNISKVGRESYRKKMQDAETLSGMLSSDEIGQLIEHGINNITKNQEACAKESARPAPDAKRIARYNQNIEDCIESIGNHLRKLNASEEVVAEVCEYIRKGDYAQVTLKVLELMVKKNPVVHGRKYKQALQMVAAAQQRTLQPQK